MIFLVSVLKELPGHGVGKGNPVNLQSRRHKAENPGRQRELGQGRVLRERKRHRKRIPEICLGLSLSVQQTADQWRQVKDGVREKSNRK